MNGKEAKGIFGGLKDVREYKAGDLRFTKKDNTLYVFAMEHQTQTSPSIPYPLHRK